MKLLIPTLLIGISGCSHQAVLTSNSEKQSEFLEFQLSRQEAVKAICDKATSDIQVTGCLILQTQLQTEQGFTVNSGREALPATPEQLAMDALKLGIGGYLGKAAIGNLARDPLVIKQEVPVIIDREVPVILP